MSQFSILLKRLSNTEVTIPSLKHLPDACIFELRDDHTVCLWPLRRYTDKEAVYDMSKPSDVELLRSGCCITYGRSYFSVSDYFQQNELPLDLFHVIHLGKYDDVYDARNMLNRLKSQL